MQTDKTQTGLKLSKNMVRDQKGDQDTSIFLKHFKIHEPDSAAEEVSFDLRTFSQTLTTKSVSIDQKYINTDNGINSVFPLKKNQKLYQNSSPL